MNVFLRQSSQIRPSSKTWMWGQEGVSQASWTLLRLPRIRPLLFLLHLDCPPPLIHLDHPPLLPQHQESPPLLILHLERLPPHLPGLTEIKLRQSPLPSEWDGLSLMWRDHVASVLTGRTVQNVLGKLTVESVVTAWSSLYSKYYYRYDPSTISMRED